VRDRGLLKAVAGTFLVKATALALLLTVFQPTYWLNHLVLDVFTWRGFFADARRGLVPSVDMAREYPVLAGALYWLMSPLMDPDHGMGCSSSTARSCSWPTSSRPGSPGRASG
jgi:hypothetical protein